MRLLLQRVSRAEVRIDGRVVGRIRKGLVVLVGFAVGDGDAEIEFLAKKLAQLRIFEDLEGKMNLSINDVQGGVLLVSQFTLYGDTRKGNRPSFVGAAPPAEAERLYERFIEVVKTLIPPGRVEQGVFRAMMEVELVNDGPVTLMLERDPASGNAGR